MRNQQEREESVDSLVSPSFSSYTSDKLADIADQVNRDYFRSLEPRDNGFEFVTLRKAANGVLLDGYVGPVFPIFNRDLLMLDENDGGNGRARESSEEEDHVMALQFRIRNLTIHHDHDPPSSSSSSDVDNSEEIPPGSYCVWTPNSTKASPSRRKKSNSTGSPPPSKRWKLLDLLRRSNSAGKDSLAFLTPTSSGSNLEKKKKEAKGENSKEKKVSAHEALYARNREVSKLSKRRSYLPYRQGLIGFGVSVDGVGRALRSF
ncbi:uncharacterized protein LOC129305540 [Prosopis cineraria]|uniref:uncharacterized protein LOC129305540 n=1 Tax=Prosopis cineraria TaxID=364024 RepID=UPI002410838E|nr:uncharacterized protein LOC129305540 [Prosopis cineraria]